MRFSMYVKICVTFYLSNTVFPSKFCNGIRCFAYAIEACSTMDINSLPFGSFSFA